MKNQKGFVLVAVLISVPLLFILCSIYYSLVHFSKVSLNKSLDSHYFSMSGYYLTHNFANRVRKRLMQMNFVQPHALSSNSAFVSQLDVVGFPFYLSSNKTHPDLPPLTGNWTLYYFWSGNNSLSPLDYWGARDPFPGLRGIRSYFNGRWVWDGLDTSSTYAWKRLRYYCDFDLEFSAFPLSQFTFFLGDNPSLPFVANSLNLNFAPSPGNFTFHQGGWEVSSSQSQFRIYSERPFSSSGNVSCDFPIVGYFSGFNQINHPSRFPQNPTSSPLSSLNYSQNYRKDYRGIMFPVHGFESNKILRRNMVYQNRRWGSGSLNHFIQFADSLCDVKFSLSANSSLVVSGGNYSSSDLAVLGNSSAWTVNSSNQTLTFAPPSGWLNSVNPKPQKIFFDFPVGWKLQVSLPSLTHVGFLNSLSLFVSGSNLILNSDFNFVEKFESVMVVSRNVEIHSHFAGVLVTEADNNGRIFNVPSSCQFMGSLIVWRIDETKNYPHNGQIHLNSLPGLLNGQRVPPLCPVGYAMRARVKHAKPFDIHSL